MMLMYSRKRWSIDHRLILIDDMQPFQQEAIKSASMYEQGSICFMGQILQRDYMTYWVRPVKKTAFLNYGQTWEHWIENLHLRHWSLTLLQYVLLPEWLEE